MSQGKAGMDFRVAESPLKQGTFPTWEWAFSDSVVGFQTTVEWPLTHPIEYSSSVDSQKPFSLMLTVVFSITRDGL